MKIICITPIKHLEGVYEELTSYGEVLYTPTINKKDLRRILEKSDISCIFTNPNKQAFKIDRELLQGTSVKIINTASTGLNHIDLEACKEFGIKVISLTKDYELIKNLPSTAELAFGLMISLLRKILGSFESVKRGEWDWEKFIGHQIKGLTSGIVGYGRLGYFMAKYCAAFGMKVIICDPYKTVSEFDQVSLQDLVQQSDVISLHVHVTDETKKMINKSIISLMKKNPYIINTSRGEIVDEKAIIDGLRSGVIAGYATDVLYDEFGNVAKSPLIKAAKEGFNIIITSHIGGMTWEGQKLAYQYAIRKFKDIR
jgi:D-3-phosphoglycerate dehydrogenase